MNDFTALPPHMHDNKATQRSCTRALPWITCICAVCNTILLLCIVGACIYMAPHAKQLVAQVEQLVSHDAPKIQSTISDVDTFLRRAEPLIPRAETTLNRTTSLLCRIPFLEPPFNFCTKHYGDGVWA